MFPPYHPVSEPPPNAIPEFAREYLRGLGQVDIIVAVLSYQNAGTIGGVAAAATQALANDFPGMRRLVLNIDAESPDGSPFIFNSTKFPEGVISATVPYRGSPGAGHALRLLAEAVAISGAKYCVVLDPALQEPDPAWVRLLAGPLLDNSADLVTPVYNYRDFDDLPNLLLAQPLTGRLVAGDWFASGATDMAFTAEVALAIKDGLPQNPATIGAGGFLWLAYNSFNNGQQIVQLASLDRDRFVRDPAVPLGQPFVQLVSAAFDIVIAATPGSRPAPPVLNIATPGKELEPVETTQAALIARFMRGAATSAALWERTLAPANLAAVQALAAGSYKGAAASNFRFPAELWVSVVFDWLRAYRANEVDYSDLLVGLGPLFNGFAASFVAATRANPAAQSEILSDLAQLFRATALDY